VQENTSLLRKILRHPLAKGSSIVFIGSVATNVSAWLYQLLVGNILGPEKYAELAALFALFYLLNVPSGVLQAILVKFFSSLKARGEFGQVKRLFIVATQKIAFFEFIVLLLAIPIVPLVANFLHMRSLIYFFWLYLIFVFTTLSVVTGSTLQAFQLFTWSSALANVSMLLRLIFGIISAFFGIGAVLIGNVFSSVLSYLAYFYPLRFIFKYQTQKLTVSKRAAVQYSVPAFFITLGITALYTQDILLVKHFFSNSEAGIYSYLSILGKVVYYASSAVGFVVFPLIAERTELKSSYNRIVSVALLFIGFVSFGLTVCYFLFPNLIILPFGPNFQRTVPYLGFFGLFISFYSLSSILIYIFLAIGKTKIWILTSCAALGQIVFISLFHSSLYVVIYVNLIMAMFLFSTLAIYYAYSQKKS